ncbi:MAG: hypothetical protein AABW88_03325, partial [Nanoarchaeota archaeon]
VSRREVSEHIRWLNVYIVQMKTDMEVVIDILEDAKKRGLTIQTVVPKVQHEQKMFSAHLSNYKQELAKLEKLIS